MYGVKTPWQPGQVEFSLSVMDTSLSPIIAVIIILGMVGSILTAIVRERLTDPIEE